MRVVTLGAAAVKNRSWPVRVRRLTLILVPALQVAFASRPTLLLLDYMSEEHSLPADIGAGGVKIPTAVRLPRQVYFEDRPGEAYAERVRATKRLALGLDPVSETFGDRYYGAQDNCYWVDEETPISLREPTHRFRQRPYNTNIYIPIEPIDALLVGIRRPESILHVTRLGSDLERVSKSAARSPSSK